MRQVVVMSGVSGSGKSTWAEKLTNTHLSTAGVNGVILSADNFFMQEGVYNFNSAKLSLVHGECFKDFITHLHNDTPLVVVDNTNTTAVEIAPYILGAQAYGYDVEVITVMCESNDDVRACARRNSHGVPFQGVMGQHKRLQERQLMPWWKNTYIPAKF